MKNSERTTTRQLSRRGFLSGATAGALVAGSPSILSALEGDSTKSYRVGIIGNSRRGGYGHDVDGAFRDFPNCKIVAIADVEEGGRARAAKRHGVKDTFADYRKMLESTKPDIVAICPTFIDEHRDMAVAAASNGAHIYMEKPFCPTLADADAVVEACDKNKVKFAFALPTRFSPKLAMAKKLIDDGAIGRVLEYRGRGKEDGRGGGQDLWVLGTHVMDMIRAIGGHPKWCFASVTQGGQPVTKKHVRKGPVGTGLLAGDAVRAMWGMPDGSTSHFHSYKNQRGNPWRYGLQVFGSRGVIEIQEGPMADVKYLGDPSWSPGRSGKKWQDVSSAGIDKPEPLKGPWGKRHYAAVRNLLAAIEGDTKALCDDRAARGATEMIVSVFESHRHRRPVDLPLTTRENPLGLLEN